MSNDKLLSMVSSLPFVVVLGSIAIVIIFNYWFKYNVKGYKDRIKGYVATKNKDIIVSIAIILIIFSIVLL